MTAFRISMEDPIGQWCDGCTFSSRGSIESSQIVLTTRVPVCWAITERIDQLNRCWWGVMDGLSMHHDQIDDVPAAHALYLDGVTAEFDPGRCRAHMEAVTGSSRPWLASESASSPPSGMNCGVSV